MGGCSIDYGMSGIYEKADRTLRVAVIYSEEDADPKIYIYSYPPDDLTLDDWIRCMEHHFDEYHDKTWGKETDKHKHDSPQDTPLSGRQNNSVRKKLPERERLGRRLSGLPETAHRPCNQNDRCTKGEEGKGKEQGKRRMGCRRD